MQPSPRTRGHLHLPTLPDPLFRFLRQLLAAMLTGVLLRQSGISLNQQWPSFSLLVLSLLTYLQIAYLLALLDDWYMKRARRRSAV